MTHLAWLLVPPLPRLFLRGVRDPVDDRVDQPAALALDLHHEDVRDDLLVSVEADRAARGMDLRGRVADGVAERRPIARLALACLDRRADELSGHVSELDVAGGPGVVLG